MTDLAKLVVRLEAETARYASELDKAKKQLGGLSEEAKKAAEQQEALQAAMTRGANVFASTRTPVEKYSQQVEELQKLLTQGAIDQDTFNRAVASAQTDLDKTNESLAQGRAVFDATRLPMEKYNAEMAKLDRLLKAGAIDQQTFNRAVASANKDLKDGEAALRKSNTTRQAFVNLTKLAGTAALAAAAGLAAMVKRSAETADQIGKLSQATGNTTEVISEIGYAADLSNISTEELAKTMQKLASSAVDATKKGSAQAAAFKALGVSVTDASGKLKSTDQILLDVADRFSKLEDGAQKAALAEDIFGRNAQKMIPFLNQGRAGIEALREEAKRLGISLSAEAAAAAGEFNDNLTRLQAVSAGLGRELTAKLLPYLIDLTETLLDVATEGDGLQEIVDGLIVVFKTFATVGIAANAVFQTVGKSIGAVIAAFDQFDFSPGDFVSPINLMMAIGRNADSAGKAVGILREGFDDIGDTVGKNVDRVVGLWTAADAKLKEVDVTAKKLKETLGGIGGQDIVQEVSVVAQKIESSPVDQLLDDFDQRTKTSFDIAQDLYNEEKEMLEQLLAAKRISVDEYNERISASFDKFLPNFEVTVDKIKDKAKKATDELSEFQKEAMRNTTDIVANGLETALEDGASKGADAALDAFGDMLQKMAMQALAANITKYLFGSPGTEGDTGGLFGSFFSAFATRDSGGRGKKGVPYMIGRRAQPELFVPDEPGEFLPAQKWMRGGGYGAGGSPVYQTINVQGLLDQKSARQHQIEAARQQRISTARLG
jgi:chromosome segregation ATPase